MRAAMINALQDHEWGSTGFIIRGIEAENVDERASQRWMRKWDNEAKAFTTPEATVDEFFAKNPVWVETVAGTQTGSTEVFRSEEHTSELQSLMRISYAVFCLKKKK